MTMLLMNSDEISWVYRCPQIKPDAFRGGAFHSARFSIFATENVDTI